MFKILKKSKKSKARLGVVQTNHGPIQTPFFMPDATRAAVKGLSNDDLIRLGLSASVINTYHLYLQPGMDIIKKARGAHKFMNWQRPLCSDSGGFQVFSLIHKNKKLGKITDDKVIFCAPLDGSKHELTPEKSIQIQFDLGADMIVCLDDCPPHNLSSRDMEKSVARTIAWAKRCKDEYERQIKMSRSLRVSRTKVRLPQSIRASNLQTNGQHDLQTNGQHDLQTNGQPDFQTNGQPDFSPADSRRPILFAVIQGGTDLGLRKKCADALLSIGFDGYGLGARPVDINGKFLTKIISGVANSIPENKLRFALGTGTPSDIIKCVKNGWDIFDCVIPTREGRHGRLYVWKRAFVETPRRGVSTRAMTTINITNSRFARDFSFINPKSKLPELRQTSRAYLHHLFKTNESQAGRLASLNNLEFYLDLMESIRVAIRKDLL